MSRSTLLLPIVLVCVACTESAPTPRDAVFVSEIDLSADGSALSAVGVTVEPSSGAVVVLDPDLGLYRLGIDGPESIADAAALRRDGVDLRPFTDTVALEDGQFVVTVQNDGLLHDVAKGTTTQHFCYLPGGMVDERQEVVSQLTHGVAYDPMARKLFAQPQTFVDGELDSAQVGSYGAVVGGQPETWSTLRKADFAATGMVWDADQLLLARDGMLYTYTLGDDRPVAFANLRPLGIDDVQGLALRADDTLVLAESGRVLELTDWRP